MKFRHKLTLTSGIAGVILLGGVAYLSQPRQPSEVNDRASGAVTREQAPPGISQPREEQASTNTVTATPPAPSEQVAEPTPTLRDVTAATKVEPRPSQTQATFERSDSGSDSAEPADNFFDPYYGVTGKIPEGWTMQRALRWGTQENTLFFKDPEHPDAAPSLYYRMFDEPMQLEGAEIESWLRQQAEAKMTQRVLGGLEDYANVDSAIRTVNNRPALTWIAEYNGRDGAAWAEYLTRIYTPNGTLLFFMRAPVDQLPDMIPEFESIIETTDLP